MTAQDEERTWWGACGNTFHEEQKQLAYLPYMGLTADWNVGHPPEVDCHGRSVIDVGGGPASLLLKCRNVERPTVVDPCEYPDWVGQRYTECGIAYAREPGETFEPGKTHFDEALEFVAGKETRSLAYPATEHFLATSEFDLGGNRWDECWIYNVLQHVDDPELLVRNARRLAYRIRIFEWTNVPVDPKHPHRLTDEDLNLWLDPERPIESRYVNRNGAVGWAYAGVVE